MIEGERETVVGDARLDAMLEAKLADPCADHAGVAAHDLAAAMGEDGAGNPLLLTPTKLFGDRRMPDLGVVAPAHHRSDDGGAIADIERDTAQRLVALTDGSEVRNVEERDAARGHAVADGRSAQRVLDRKGLEAHRLDRERLAVTNVLAVRDWIVLQQRPGLLGGMHRAGRALGKSRSVIGMGVGDYDCGRIDPFLMVEPIGAAIDHHARIAQPHQQSAVAKMAARPDLDLATGAEKGELDAALLTLLDRDPLLVPLDFSALLL